VLTVKNHLHAPHHNKLEFGDDVGMQNEKVGHLPSVILA
jgi:hypothetical protein